MHPITICLNHPHYDAQGFAYNALPSAVDSIARNVFHHTPLHPAQACLHSRRVSKGTIEDLERPTFKQIVRDFKYESFQDWLSTQYLPLPDGSYEVSTWSCDLKQLASLLMEGNNLPEEGRIANIRSDLTPPDLQQSYYYSDSSIQGCAKLINWYPNYAVAAKHRDEAAAILREEGDRYYFGQGVTQDYTEAVKQYRLAAEQGYVGAQSNLGMVAALVSFVSMGGAFVWWFRRAAAQGNATAQFYLGVCYYNGLGVTQDYTQAVRWFRRAAAQGHAQAQNNLGVCYEHGHGAPQDYAGAIKWYRLAVEGGIAIAQKNLGLCYYYGHGVNRDYTEAISWFRLAAGQGETAAQNNLGVCYQHGLGVTRDYTEAVKWYRLAAEQKVAGAQFNLGVCYYSGRGVTQDYRKAVRWFHLAAEQGHALAQLRLAWCYHNGRGVPQDRVKAARWFRKAEANQ